MRLIRHGFTPVEQLANSDPFVVHGLEQRTEGIVEVGSEAAGEIATGLRVTRIMETSPFAVLCDVLGNAGKLVGGRMFR